ncbi:hypothetical protein HPB50_026418 [Hyalomma asiaticum]|uniref:Uncharacterized protein n=1 Tax=Hyalomma asiaticum TaxID=266040 RepID=A0ACB7RQK3_HYAAI|nr:hypothetical protein HPB50_026418 [Hyalomma asiaticum]
MSAGEDTPDFLQYFSEEESDVQLNGPNAECSGMAGNYDEDEDEADCTVLACESCGACFSSAEFLMRHQRYGHTGSGQKQPAGSREEPDVKAPVLEGSACGQWKSRGSSVRTCDVCGRHFTNSSHLSRHRKTHSRNSNEFVCPDCWLSFARKDALQRHVVTHTGQRPYLCRVCGVGFTQRSSATRHERNIHGLQ